MGRSGSFSFLLRLIAFAHKHQGDGSVNLIHALGKEKGQWTFKQVPTNGLIGLEGDG